MELKEESYPTYKLKVSKEEYDKWMNMLNSKKTGLKYTHIYGIEFRGKSKGGSAFDYFRLEVEEDG